MRRSTVLLATVVAVLAGLTATAAEAVSVQQVLVRFEPGTSAASADQLLRGAGAVRAGTVYGSDVLVVRGAALTQNDLARRIAASPLVDYAEPDFDLRLLLSNPNDPRFGEQYAHQRISSVAGWTAYPGSYTSSGGPAIAVIDTGIDTNHEDLVGRIDTANSSCFLGLLCLLGGFEDDHGHGTHVSGIAAASTNNAKGVAGVAFNTTIMALKACDLVGSCPTSATSGALNWARTHGAKVVNMSFGGSGNSQTLQTAVQQAHAAGLVLVAAAGNNGNATLNYPAAYNEVISAAATDSNDNRASFSNANADVELAAPGVSVLSSYLTGGYTTLSGTSMASPHVAGLAALLRGQNPGWTNTQARDRMNSCADDLGAAGRDPQYGFGRINLARALGSC